MDFIKIVVLPMIGLFVMLIAFAIGAAAIDCVGYQSATGKETRMVMGSCYVKDSGHWYAWSEYKYRLATKGEFTK